MISRKWGWHARKIEELWACCPAIMNSFNQVTEPSLHAHQGEEGRGRAATAQLTWHSNNVFYRADPALLAWDTQMKETWKWKFTTPRVLREHGSGASGTAQSGAFLDGGDARRMSRMHLVKTGAWHTLCLCRRTSDITGQLPAPAMHVLRPLTSPLIRLVTFVMTCSMSV